MLSAAEQTTYMPVQGDLLAVDERLVWTLKGGGTAPIEWVTADRGGADFLRGLLNGLNRLRDGRYSAP